jgi:hypothetical protein
MKQNSLKNVFPATRWRVLIASSVVVVTIIALLAVRSKEFKSSPTIMSTKHNSDFEAGAPKTPADIVPTTVNSVDYEALYSEINSQWKARNYSEIDVIADRRLKTNRNDVLALGLKQCNKMLGARNIIEAHANAKKILEVSSHSKNTRFKILAVDFTNWAFQILPSEGDLSAVQHDAIHRELEDFPFIAEIFTLWRLSNEEN